jgi:hypothetical protein
LKQLNFSYKFAVISSLIPGEDLLDIINMQADDKKGAQADQTPHQVTLSSLFLFCFGLTSRFP